MARMLHDHEKPADCDQLMVRVQQGEREAFEKLVETFEGPLQRFFLASATSDHMTTTYRALQARLAEAKRRSEGLERGATPAESETAVPADSEGVDGDAERRIEDELNRLRAELGGEAE